MELGIRRECVGGERETRFRELSLGPFPAQENPDHLSDRGEIGWGSETVRYIPLKESEIVAPSSMFIVADKAG